MKVLFLLIGCASSLLQSAPDRGLSLASEFFAHFQRVVFERLWANTQRYNESMTFPEFLASYIFRRGDSTGLTEAGINSEGGEFQFKFRGHLLFDISLKMNFGPKKMIRAFLSSEASSAEFLLVPGTIPKQALGAYISRNVNEFIFCVEQVIFSFKQVDADLDRMVNLEFEEYGRMPEHTKNVNDWVDAKKVFPNYEEVFPEIPINEDIDENIYTLKPILKGFQENPHKEVLVRWKKQRVDLDDGSATAEYFQMRVKRILEANGVKDPDLNKFPKSVMLLNPVNEGTVMLLLTLLKLDGQLLISLTSDFLNISIKTNMPTKRFLLKRIEYMLTELRDITFYEIDVFYYNPPLYWSGTPSYLEITLDARINEYFKLQADELKNFSSIDLKRFVRGDGDGWKVGIHMVDHKILPKKGEQNGFYIEPYLPQNGMLYQFTTLFRQFYFDITQILFKIIPPMHIFESETRLPPKIFYYKATVPPFVLQDLTRGDYIIGEAIETEQSTAMSHNYFGVQLSFYSVHRSLTIAGVTHNFILTKCDYLPVAVSPSKPGPLDALKEVTKGN